MKKTLIIVILLVMILSGCTDRNNSNVTSESVVFRPVVPPEQQEHCYEVVVMVDSGQRIRSGFDLDDDDNIIVPAALRGYTNEIHFSLGTACSDIETAEKIFCMWYTAADCSFMSLPGGGGYTWINIPCSLIKDCYGNSALTEWVAMNPDESVFIAMTDLVSVEFRDISVL